MTIEANKILEYLGLDISIEDLLKTKIKIKRFNTNEILNTSLEEYLRVLEHWKRPESAKYIKDGKSREDYYGYYVDNINTIYLDMASDMMKQVFGIEKLKELQHYQDYIQNFFKSLLLKGQTELLKHIDPKNDNYNLIEEINGQNLEKHFAVILFLTQDYSSRTLVDNFSFDPINILINEPIDSKYNLGTLLKDISRKQNYNDPKIVTKIYKILTEQREAINNLPPETFNNLRQAIASIHAIFKQIENRDNSLSSRTSSITKKPNHRKQSLISRNRPITRSIDTNNNYDNLVGVLYGISSSQSRRFSSSGSNYHSVQSHLSSSSSDPRRNTLYDITEEASTPELTSIKYDVNFFKQKLNLDNRNYIKTFTVLTQNMDNIEEFQSNFLALLKDDEVLKQIFIQNVINKTVSEAKEFLDFFSKLDNTLHLNINFNIEIEGESIINILLKDQNSDKNEIVNKISNIIEFKKKEDEELLEASEELPEIDPRINSRRQSMLSDSTSSSLRDRLLKFISIKPSTNNSPPLQDLQKERPTISREEGAPKSEQDKIIENVLKSNKSFAERIMKLSRATYSPDEDFDLYSSDEEQIMPPSSSSTQPSQKKDLERVAICYNVINNIVVGYNSETSNKVLQSEINQIENDQLRAAIEIIATIGKPYITENEFRMLYEAKSCIDIISQNLQGFDDIKQQISKSHEELLSFADIKTNLEILGFCYQHIKENNNEGLAKDIKLLKNETLELAIKNIQEINIKISTGEIHESDKEKLDHAKEVMDIFCELQKENQTEAYVKRVDQYKAYFNSFHEELSAKILPSEKVENPSLDNPGKGLGPGVHNKGIN